MKLLVLSLLKVRPPIYATLHAVMEKAVKEEGLTNNRLLAKVI